MTQWSLRYDSLEALLQRNGMLVYGKPMLRCAIRCRSLARFRPWVSSQRVASSVITERSFAGRHYGEALEMQSSSSLKVAENADFNAKMTFSFVLIFHSYLDFYVERRPPLTGQRFRPPLTPPNLGGGLYSFAAMVLAYQTNSPPQFLDEPSGKAERGGVRGGLN